MSRQDTGVLTFLRLAQTPSYCVTETSVHMLSQRNLNCKEHFTIQTKGTNKEKKGIICTLNF